MKRVSVIVPIYHGEKYISNLIQQVEVCRDELSDEDYVEIVFVNDAPDTPIRKKWKSKSVDINIINSETNEGIHSARIKGLLNCSGDYVLFLDQDDKIYPHFFHSQLQMIKENDAVVCNTIYAGNRVYPDNDYFKKVTVREYMLKLWNPIISPGQVLIRKKSIPNVWKKNVLQNNGADDWFLWLCMIADNAKFVLNNVILYKHVEHEKNTSNDIEGMLKSEQELMYIVYDQRIFGEDEFRLLMEGFFFRETNRIRELVFFKSKLDLLIKWKALIKKGANYSGYLLSQGLKKVAIYGCGILGEYLYDELKESMEIKYFIDRNARELREEIPVYTLQDLIPDVDGVIITLINEVEIMEIKKMIRMKLNKNIFLLKDWVMNNDL